MVKIKKIDMPPYLWYCKCPFEMTPTRIVIHNSANNASAENEIKYMHSNSDYTSYHYAVDDIEAIQGLPLDRNGYHAGDGETGKGNREGIGIEICYSYCKKYVNGQWVADEATWKSQYKKKFEKAQANAAELTAYLLHTYGWGMDKSRITKHQDYSGKYCPHRTLDDYGWDYFLNLVEIKYKEMYEGEAPMTKEEKKAFDKLSAKVEELKKQTDSLKEELKVYHYWSSLPAYAKEPLLALYNKGYFKGAKPSDLNVNRVKMENLVVLARVLRDMGVIDYKG